MIDGFEPVELPGEGGLVLRGCIGGNMDAPPLLLLHGYPQTHEMWHGVAPALAETHRVICLDLPGYGASDAPPLSDDHTAYAKRSWAPHFVAAMTSLGHDTFAVAAHDRGARAAYRLALDHPQRVSKLALLDIIPTTTMWDFANAQFAIKSFHWGFLAQPAPFPEKMIEGDPDRFVDYCLAKWAGEDFRFDAAAQDTYRAAFRNPSVISASCEDYRAGATRDVEIDRQSIEDGQTYEGPVLLLWGAQNFGADTDMICGLWTPYLPKAGGVALGCGHFVAEEEPAETVRALTQFLATP